MFEFNVSYYGIAIVVFWILFSLFIKFIFKENLKIKNQKIILDKKIKPGRIFQNVLQEKNINLKINSNANFWIKDFDFNKKFLNLSKSYIDNNLYSLINSVFFANQIIYGKKFFAYRVVLFILFIILSFSLITNLWILAIIFFILYVLLVICRFFYDREKDLVIFKETKIQLSNILTKEIMKQANCYLKYKKINYLYFPIIGFIDALTDFIKLFVKWGK